MKLSRDWLTDFIDLDGVSNERLAEIITTRIAEVDRVSEFEDSDSKQIDFIIEIDNKSLTHRPDLWSHFGFAKELSGVLQRNLKSALDLEQFADDNSAGKAALDELKKQAPAIGVTFAPETKMRRMVCCLFEGVQIVESPAWMRRRLVSIGAGVRNFLVDLSNYVMHDCGQPNHFFDADKIEGKSISIRFAKPGEPLTTLDGRDRNLSAEDLVIADDVKALDIGGVMGGANTSIADSTHRILFTAGSWDPVLVRRSSSRNQARTDAAQRFEKNLSPYFPVLALQRVRQLLSEGCPNAVLKGGVADVFPEPPKPVKIFLPAKLVSERLGVGAPSFEEGCKILSRLRLKLEGQNAEGVSVTVPHYRATRDLSIPEDLIEEIGRCHGYENITEQAPRIATYPSLEPKLTELEREFKDLLRGRGFSEVSNYSFVRPDYSEQLGYSLDNGVTLLNPIDETQGALRTSLIPGMIQVVEGNSRFFETIQLFEIGRGYFKTASAEVANLKTKEKYQNAAAIERRFLALAYNSAVSPSTSFPIESGAEFYVVAGVIRQLARSDRRGK